MECSPKQKPWSAQRIVHELMALWFGSVHVLSTVRTGIIVFLRETILTYQHKNRQSASLYMIFVSTQSTLSLYELNAQSLKDQLCLTVLLKNQCAPRPSSRVCTLNLFPSLMVSLTVFFPAITVSTRRQALKPFELPDGHKIQVGDWICTPARAMMRDPANYTDPLKFDGFRFVDPERLAAIDEVSSRSVESDLKAGISHSGKDSRLTDVTDWQVWGTGRMAW
jgi:hypothetical protein